MVSVSCDDVYAFASEWLMVVLNNDKEQKIRRIELTNKGQAWHWSSASKLNWAKSGVLSDDKECPIWFFFIRIFKCIEQTEKKEGWWCHENITVVIEGEKNIFRNRMKNRLSDKIIRSMFMPKKSHKIKLQIERQKDHGKKKYSVCWSRFFFMEKIRTDNERSTKKRFFAAWETKRKLVRWERKRYEPD